MLIILLNSWAKAGLAGDWILLLTDFLIVYTITLCYQKKYLSKKLFIYLLPLFFIILQGVVSFLNPSYRSLSDEEWKKINIDNKISNEPNILKAKFALDSFNKIFKSSKHDRELSLNLFYDFKNKFYNTFSFNNSPTDKVIIEYQNLIDLNSIYFLPSSTFSYPKLYLEFTHFIFQLLFGVIAYYSVGTLSEIRKVLFILSLNSGFLALAGIVQKFNYIPSENINEIWGIWNAPEPRYYFSSFTYKNHWSAFCIITLAMAFSIIHYKFCSNKYYFYRDKKFILLIVSIIIITISIPISSSRSGILVLIIFLFFIFLLLIKIHKIKLMKSFFYFLVSIIIIIISLRIDNNSNNIMVQNTKNQISDLRDGKLPFRLLLWNDIIKQISDKPIWGHGFNSYKALNPIYQSKATFLERNVVTKNAHHDFTPIVGYAHNDWLEKISEFGLIGILPFLFITIASIKLLFGTKSVTVKILLLGVLSFLVYSFLDFPTRTPCSLLVLTLVIGLAFKYDKIIRKTYLKL
jgi:O-antigen ligase